MNYKFVGSQILLFLLVTFAISIVEVSGQCPTTTSFLPAPSNGFKTDVDYLEVGKTLKVTADATLSSATKSTIKYKVGFSDNTFKASDFDCNGANASKCVSAKSVIIPVKTDSKVVTINDFDVVFYEPGVYTIIQTYTSPAGYYQCKQIVVYPKPVFEYFTCNGEFVFVTIPNVPDNQFFDEIEVEFSSIDKQTQVKSQYGSQQLVNAIRIPGFSGTNYDRSSFEVRGRKVIPNFSSIVIGGVREQPIQFVAKQNPINKSGSTFKITDLYHQENNDILISLTTGLDAMEISYNGNDNSSYNFIPSQNVVFSNNGKEAKITGLGNLPIDKQICFRGAILSNACGSLPNNLRPVACLTGEIKTITDKIGQTTGERDIQVELVDRSKNVSDLVAVFRNSGTPQEKFLSSSSLIFEDVSAICTDLTYRAITKLNQSTVNQQNIYSKPKKYKIQNGTLPALDGVSVVTVKNLGTNDNQMTIQVNYSTTSNSNKFNFYSAPFGSDNFTKINPTPSNQTTIGDSQKSPTTGSNCYYITYQDQCGYESIPTDPICTVHLQSATPYTTNWSKNEVATNKPTRKFAEIINYTLQEIECGANGCIAVKDYPSTTSNVYNMEVTDTDPDNVHFKDFWLNVNTAPSLTVISNIVRYYFPPKIYYPNTFTPNGDSFNDTFNFEGLHINGFKASIYDRWGAEVKKFETIKDRWDGDNAPEGIYTFKCEALDFNPTPRKIALTGYFNLLR